MKMYVVCTYKNHLIEANLIKTHNISIVLGHIAIVIFHRITITCLYDFDPLKPHFYIVKLGFTRVYIIFLNSVQKHRLWVLVRTASPSRNMF